MTTAEAVYTINDENTSCSLDDKQQLKRKHVKAIFNKNSFKTNMRRVVKKRTVNAQDLERELKQDARTATKKYAINKRLYEQSK